MLRSHLVSLALLAAVAFAGALPALAADPATAPSSATPGTEAVRAVAPELARFNDLLAGLAESLKPGLVHVRVQRAAPARSEDRDEGEPRRSTGSGFVIDANGMIVTNAHVVEGVASAQVRLFDGRRFTGRVIGRDNRVDLALLKIDGATNLTVLPLGDSNRLRVGEFVLVLGHPFGLEHTVSFGIVSRKGAPLAVAAPGFDFIQTDAAINPGNSGGPLVNMAGEVVGVNSMAARNGSIGFAIPANLVKMLLPQLVAKGQVEWGWLGVAITEVGDEDVEKLKLSEAHGVLIRSVMPGEPADRAGVKANDVILALDGTRLEGPRDLQRVVASTPVGKRVRALVMRGGKPQELEVEIGKYKEPEDKR
ncbi:MAG: trypsin-like peptidase domain-containing protein [Candidatus Rokubacteria bacterium]|nr:trypsin-like peptidase domain-containing protein [Candidatus Rokubacteria bacterium]